MTKLTNWQYWIYQNLQLLSKTYGKTGVGLVKNSWNSILINHYRLPSSWKQMSTRLFIILPKTSKIFHKAPDRFYINLGLRTINNKVPAHYFEKENYNDLKDHNFARFSFHLKTGWHPQLQCLTGTNLIHVLDGLYHGLDRAAKEAMK